MYSKFPYSRNVIKVAFSRTNNRVLFCMDPWMHFALKELAIMSFSLGKAGGEGFAGPTLCKTHVFFPKAYAISRFKSQK